MEDCSSLTDLSPFTSPPILLSEKPNSFIFSLTASIVSKSLPYDLPKVTISNKRTPNDHLKKNRRKSNICLKIVPGWAI